MIEVIVKLLTLAAFAATLIVAVRSTIAAGCDPNVMMATGMWSIFGAIIGGSLLGLVSNLFLPSFQSARWVDYLLYNKSTFGAFSGCAGAAFVYLRIYRKSFLVYADLAVPAIALGYAMARIACFVNGDDFGVVSSMPWATRFAAGTEAYAVHLQRGWIEAGASYSLPTHPTQLYSALVGVFGFIVLSRYKSGGQGDKLALALFIYGVTRFLIQFYRDDHFINPGPIDYSQWLSVLLVALSIGLLLRKRIKKRSRVFMEENEIKQTSWEMMK